MAGEKIVEKTEAVAPGLKSNSSNKLTEKDMVSKKDGKVSDSLPSLGAVTGIKGEIDQPPVAEQGAYYPPTGYFDYYYPGYNGTFNQLDDQAYFNAGIQSDNGSLVYYMPGYSPYSTGFVGGDGKQPYASSGYLQQPVSYGSESLPCYSWGSTYCTDMTNGTAPKSGNVKSTFGRNGPVKSNGFNSTKTNSSFSNKNSNMLFNPKARQSTAPSNQHKSIHQAQPFKPASKFQSDVHSGGINKGFYPAGDFRAYTNHNQGFFMPYDAINYQTSGRLWNVNYNRYKSKGNFPRNGVSEPSSELPRGPRADNRSNPSKPSVEEDQLGPMIDKEKYNKEDFKTQYDNAKFYVIKSYSEDDIHKCVKYDVWSSTPNGNKKLDSAFRGIEGLASGNGSSCPVFLFFSVNGSGQFLGVAEMIGQVDFNRNMDFWQLDKWNGFFPVKWHIVKDVPNTQFKHIILQNNDNRPVTYSRDTQEIGLKEGLEILGIFKNYSEKTSIFDDFSFYDKREKLLKAKRNSKPASQADDMFDDPDSLKHFKGDEILEEGMKTNTPDPAASLIHLTKNLSINSQPFKK